MTTAKSRTINTWPTRYGPYAAITAATVVFAVLLTFALTRLFQIERQMNSGSGENLLWALMQAQQESQSLLVAASLWDRSSKGQEDTDQLRLRYDIAVSRFPLLREGTMAHRITELEFEPKLATAQRTLFDLGAKIEAAISSGAQLGIVVQSSIQSVVNDLRVIANKLMIDERDRSGKRRDEYRKTLFEIIASIIGILASGIILIAHLVHSLRRNAAAERALREDTDFLHLLLDSSGEGIMAIDREMRVTHWNSGMTRLLGIPAEVMVGAVFTDVLQMQDDHPVAAALHRTLEGLRGFLPENPLPNSDRIVEKASFPLRSGGTIIGAIAFIRDVTERIQAQRALARHLDELELQVQDRTKDLREAEWQLRSAINTAPDGLAAFDAQGRLVLANTRARDLFPAGPTLFAPGSRLADVLKKTQIPLAVSTNVLDAEEKLMIGELQLTTGIWLQATLRSSAEGSSVLRLVDVTSYKQAALTLEKALKRERNLRELYKNFVSMVSHQFRTPLAIIDSSAQRMLRRSADMDADEITNRAGKIRTAALRLTKLVEATLDAARFDAGQIDFHPKACNFGKLVRDACDRQRELNPRRAFQLSLDALPRSIVCDPLLLDQVVANLLSNASKYSPEREPIVVSASASAEAVELTIRDRGIGIPDDEVPRLFERFFRASTAAGIEGTGIGLHVAREIARMHDGDILVETREGDGSAFTLRLPLLPQRTRIQDA